MTVLLLSLLVATPQAKADLPTRFLDEVVGFLSEEPRDGRFGMARVPALHGKYGFQGAPESTAQTSWATMKERSDLFLNTFARPKSDPSSGKLIGRMRTFQAAPGEVQSPRAGWKQTTFHEAYGKLIRELQQNAFQMMKQPKRTGVGKGSFLGSEMIVHYRAVLPSSKKCLSCHPGQRMDEPIGVLTLVQVSRK